MQLEKYYAQKKNGPVLDKPCTKGQDNGEMILYVYVELCQNIKKQRSFSKILFIFDNDWL